jgi:polygalacturonase
MYQLLSVIVSILSYGAVPNNTTVNNASAINQAINDCADRGGGVVNVPRGSFSTGSIFLKSGVTLNIEEGGVIKGTSHVGDYSPLITTADLSKYDTGQGTVNYNSATDPIWSQALIFGVGLKDSRITGTGTIDGNNVRNPLGEEHMRGPHGILLADSEKIKIDGVKIVNASNYAILAYKIEDVTIRNVSIEGGWDGIHVRGAQRMMIKNCQISTGDDGIAGGYWEQMRIDGCKINSSCNGIRMIQPSVNVIFNDCDIYGPGVFEHITSHSKASLAAINIEPGAWGKAPGLLDRITIRNCRMKEVLTPLSVTLSDDNHLGLITLKDVKATDITNHALSVKSWGIASTDRVELKNCDMEFRGIDDPNLPSWFETHGTNEWPVFPSWGLYFRNVKKIKQKNVKLHLKGKDYRNAVIEDKSDRE